MKFKLWLETQIVKPEEYSIGPVYRGGPDIGQSPDFKTRPGNILPNNLFFTTSKKEANRYAVQPQMFPGENVREYWLHKDVLKDMLDYRENGVGSIHYPVFNAAHIFDPRYGVLKGL